MVWKKETTRPVMFEDKKLYFEDSSQCYYVWGKNGTPSILYSIENDVTRYEDCIVYAAKVSVVPQPRDDFANCFLGLTKTNHVVRRDNLTGRLLNDIIIGPEFRFSQLNWQVNGVDVILQSVYSQKNGVENKTVLQAMLLFSIQPFKLKCLFELKKSVVGKDFSMGNASENILILGGPGGRIVMYSLPDLIKMNRRLCECSLGQDCERSHGAIGCCSNGIPLTHDIQNMPPILFQLKCFDSELFFGGFPFHYIFTPIHKNGTFKIVDVASGHESAEIDLTNDTIHPDKCFFHYDESGRIIYESAHAVHVYTFRGDGRDSRPGPMKLQFTMTAGSGLLEIEETRSQEGPSAAKRPRRSCSRRLSTRDSVSLFDRTVFVLDYENELELLSILATDFESDEGLVLMYDNITGKLLRKVSLDILLREVSFFFLITFEYITFLDIQTQLYRMTVDMDAIVIIEAKHDFQHGRKDVVYLYKLRRSTDQPQMKPQTTVIPERRQRTRRTRSRRPRIHPPSDDEEDWF